MDQLAQHTRSGQFAAKILAPQLDVDMTFTGPGRRPTEAMSLTMLALQQEMHDPEVDTSRIYVTGLSMGAFGTWDILNRAPKVFAAAVPMSGGGNPATAANIKDVPVWAFHGSDDSVVPVQTTRDMIAALEAAGGTPRYTELAGADHTIWDSVYADADNTLYPWLFSKSALGPVDPGQLNTDLVFTTGGTGGTPDPVSDSSTPEPTSMGLLALAGMGLLGRRRASRR
jgi:predicted peptidase